MATYGDWVQESTREFTQRRGPSAESNPTVTAFKGGYAIRRDFYNRPLMVYHPGDIPQHDTIVYEPFTESEGISAVQASSGIDSIAEAFIPWEMGAATWMLGYDHAHTMGKDDVYSIGQSYTQFGMRQVTLMDPGAYKWRGEAFSRAIQQNPDRTVIGIEWHPDDHYHGSAANRRLRFRSWPYYSVGHTRVRESDTGADGGPLAFPDPDPLPPSSPRTVTTLKLVNRTSSLLSPDVHAIYSPASTALTDEAQWSWKEFGIPNPSAPYTNNIPAGALRIGTDWPVVSGQGTPDIITASNFHQTIGEFPLDSQWYEVGIDPGDEYTFPVRDETTTTTWARGQGMKAFQVAIGPRVMLAYGVSGFVDWPEIAGLTDAVKQLWVQTDVEYVCDWTPPRYRVIFADEIPDAVITGTPRDTGGRFAEHMNDSTALESIFAR